MGPQTLKLGVIILGAGRSARMGRPKLLLPWGKTTVVGHLLGQWRELGSAQIAVVCAAGDEALGAELTRLNFPAEDRIVNPAPERGMFSSILCAARWPGWRAELTHWALALGDQPHLRPSTLQALLQAAAAKPDEIWQPASQGKAGHPVLFPKTWFQALADSRAATLREFLDSLPVRAQLCPVDDPGLHLDLDSPEDYAAAIS